jgi:precorrin-8X/cobalt-precorrin-8 methylmutase
MNIEHPGADASLSPADIERRSFEIIESELKIPLDERHASIVKRVIHTTADFEYAETLCFSENAVDVALRALRAGATIVTDTTMALAGINKPALAKLGCEAVCYMGEPRIAEIAKKNGTTKAVAAVDEAAALQGDVIFAVGNAPTALLRLCELIQTKKISPALVIGVPVGFVNVVQSKESIMASGVPYIVNKGRKGGSTVAVAIVNALLYRLARVCV